MPTNTLTPFHVTEATTIPLTTHPYHQPKDANSRRGSFSFIFIFFTRAKILKVCECPYKIYLSDTQYSKIF